MAEVHRLPEPRRQLITDGERSDLRATWHNEAGYVIISLWRGETCVATSHLSPKEAGRLASFITGGLADLAHERTLRSSVVTPLSSRSSWRNRLGRAVTTGRDSVGSSLERIARMLRSTR